MDLEEASTVGVEWDGGESLGEEVASCPAEDRRHARKPSLGFPKNVGRGNESVGYCRFLHGKRAEEGFDFYVSCVESSA